MAESKQCENYCGVACVDGSCPVANLEEYIERGYDLVKDCEECNYYKGCEDCCFNGDNKYCPKLSTDTDTQKEV